MESRKKGKNTSLPRTSRVNDKILEYYRKYGKDRDLEKFMRLYSPAGSQRSFRSRSRSRSRNRTRTTTTTVSSCASSDGYHFELHAVRPFQSKSLPNIEMRKMISVEVSDQKHEAPANDEEVVVEICSSAAVQQEPQTPKKESPGIETKGTQTPDSIVKSHKRLEWDSLGDVGYNKKSMSTSNISVLERSLLRDFFQEYSSKTQITKETITNVFESDLKRQHENLPKHENRQHSTTTETKYNTPPLASSTFAEPKCKTHHDTGARPKLVSKSTSTSLQKKFEKYAQTTLQTSAVTNSKEVQVNITPPAYSIAGSSATPSSFEYYSSRSSRSSVAPIADCQIQNLVQLTTQAQHPFVTDITEMLSRRKVLAERRDSKNLKQIAERVRQAITENKENENEEVSCPSSTSSVTGSSQLDWGVQLLCSLANARSLNHKQKKKLVRDIVMCITRLGGGSEAPCASSINDNVISTKSEKEPHSIKPTLQKKPDTDRSNQVESKFQPANESSNSDCDQLLNVEDKKTTLAKPTKIPEDMPIQSMKTTTNPSNSSPTSTTTVTTADKTGTTSSTSMREVMTQKPATSNLQDAANNTDQEQATMREWLNPLTQSEIEYETKKREQMKKDTQRPQMLSENKKKDAINALDREFQLDWIESEISRLKGLKSLLLKSEESVRTIVYDTVCSDPSAETIASLNDIVEHQTQKVEVIAEKSQETRTLCTKLRTDQSEPIAEHNICIRQTRETSEEQVLPISVEADLNQKQELHLQRSKIDTPSGDSESVCSFVQQRKREFMEHYKNKRNNHYEAVLQQQQKEQKTENRPATVANGVTKKCNHYSVPHTIPRKYSVEFSPHQGHRFHHYFNHAPLYRPAPPPPPTATASRNRNYTISTGLTTITPNAHNSNSSSSLFCLSSEVSIPMGSKNSSSTPTTTHQYDDVAGAGAVVTVGIQTTGSLLRSHPIFGPQTDQRTSLAHTQTVPAMQSVCVQVKPKAIAYVIRFDAKTSSESLSNDVPLDNTTSHASNEQALASPLTLQEHLQRAKPKFCAQSKQRKAILNEIQVLRQQRDREMREIVDNTSLRSLDHKLQGLRPPPTQTLRVFPTKEMKARTNNRCAKLPEVVEKQQREREERRRRSNRLLRDVFNRRLQKRVRNGKISLNHSRTVI